MPALIRIPCQLTDVSIKDTRFTHGLAFEISDLSAIQRQLDVANFYCADTLNRSAVDADGVFRYSHEDSDMKQVTAIIQKSDDQAFKSATAKGIDSRKACRS